MGCSKSKDAEVLDVTNQETWMVRNDNKMKAYVHVYAVARRNW